MYIGLKEVKSIDGSTVLFADGMQKEYTPKQLSYIVTEEEQDLTAYMELVMTNLMLEMQPVIDQNLEEVETVAKLLEIAVDHNLTQEQMHWVQQRIVSSLIARHNAFMEEKVWKEIEEFNKNLVRYKDICQTLDDSHKRIMCIAVGKALWTYVEGEPFNTYRSELTYAHFKPFI